MNQKFRWALVLLVVAWSLYAMLPLNEKIKLGLDLQGGMHVVLGVDSDKAVEARTESLAAQVRKLLQSEKKEFSYVQKASQNSLRIGLSNQSDRKVLSDLVEQNFPFLKNIGTTGEDNTLVYGLDAQEVDRIKDYAVSQSLEVVRNRIDQFGVSEPLIQRQGKDHILVQLPGITDPERAISLIGKTAQLKFMLVDEQVDPNTAVAGNVPFDSVLKYQKVVDKVSGKTTSTVPYVLKREALLTGEYLMDAEVRINSQFNEPYVWIKFDAAGSKLFEELTTTNVGKRMAIVLDDNVYSAPNIREKIAGGEAQISGAFSLEEAKDLAIVLRAGSLPAPVSILENRTVGPTLGADSIQDGLMAALIGVGLVLIFMGIYYRLCGMVANTALVLNLVILLGVMATVKATMTLPGIAGVILMLGMAVDANVLIFERIRDELRLGRTPMNAMEIGYEKALVTILDSNITTIIAAAVLFQFGTGPVKGFAVTLSIGIIVSMFTAIFVTRTVFNTFLKGKDVKSLSI